MNNVVLPADSPPATWVDACDLLASATEPELALGKAMGQLIDVDDEFSGSLLMTRGVTSDDRARAMDKARKLKAIMLEHGVPEVSLELMPGRPNSWGVWDALFPVADMSHHTVSKYSATNRTPCLSLCKFGRSDLPGPLCNGYGGWDLCYRVITLGYANHPGEGGPKTVPALTAGTFTIPKDSARRYAWGTEFEGGLNEADWDRKLTNPRTGDSMTFREFMGRTNAALEVWLEIAEGAHLEHSTWTSRKIDRLHYTAAEGIAEKRKYELTEPEPNPEPGPTPNITQAIAENLAYAKALDEIKAKSLQDEVERFRRVLKSQRRVLRDKEKK